MFVGEDLGDVANTLKKQGDTKSRGPSRPLRNAVNEWPYPEDEIEKM